MTSGAGTILDGKVDTFKKPGKTRCGADFVLPGREYFSIQNHI